MKSLPVIFLCVAGAAAGSGLGWVLRGASPHPSENPNQNAVSGRLSMLSAKKAAHSLGPDVALEAARVDEIKAELVRQPGALRWLYLLGAAEEASAGDMPRLVRAASSEPAALRMLAVRWAELDPKHMFDTLCADAARSRVGIPGSDLSAVGDLKDLLFETWMQKDQKAAIEALGNLSALPKMDAVRLGIASNIMKSDPAQAFKLMHDWNLRNYVPPLDGISQWVAKNPRTAAESVIAADLGSLGSQVLDRVGREWAAADPESALAFAGEHRGSAGQQLAQGAFAAWAARDFQAAVSWLNARNDAVTRAMLGPPLIETWSKTDPQAAFVWANENLKGDARSAAASTIVKSMAEQNIDSAAAFIAGLESGTGKNMAASQLVTSWLAKNRPEDAAAAFKWMTSIPDSSARDAALQSASWRMVDLVPESVMNYLSTPDGAKAPPGLVDYAARHLTQDKGPTMAMDWTTKMPEGQRMQAQRSVLSNWLTTQPESALDWLRTQPDGNARNSFVASATSQLSWQSFETARQWVQSLSAADRPAALTGLRQTGPALSSQNRAALEAMLK